MEIVSRVVKFDVGSNWKLSLETGSNLQN